MKDDVICVARHRQVGHGTIGLREFELARFASRRTSNREMAACRGEYYIHICALSFTTMFYSLRKILSREDRISALTQLKVEAM